MFELVASQPSHLITTDVLNLTPGNLLYSLFINSELYEFAKSYIYKYTPLYFIFP